MQKGNVYLEQYKGSIAEYIRDEDGRKRGLMIAIKASNPKGYSIGWSLFNKNSEKVPFNKTIAYGLALTRANEPDVDQNVKSLPFTVMEHYKRMERRAKKYFCNPDKEKNPDFVKIPTSKGYTWKKRTK